MQPMQHSHIFFPANIPHTCIFSSIPVHEWLSLLHTHSHTPHHCDLKTLMGASSYRTVFNLFASKNGFHYSDPNSYWSILGSSLTLWEGQRVMLGCSAVWGRPHDGMSPWTIPQLPPVVKDMMACTIWKEDTQGHPKKIWFCAVLGQNLTGVWLIGKI